MNKKAIIWIIIWVVLILLIRFVIYANNLARENEAKLLEWITPNSSQDYCIKWIKEQYNNDRNLFIESIEETEIQWIKTIHWKLLYWEELEYFCFENEAFKKWDKWNMTQLLVGTDLFDFE